MATIGNEVMDEEKMVTKVPQTITDSLRAIRWMFDLQSIQEYIFSTFIAVLGFIQQSSGQVTVIK